MALLLYQALGALVLVGLAAALPFVPRWREGFRERLGLGAGPAPDGPGELVWVHAASVGEVRAAVPFVEALLRARPGVRVLLSTLTPSGGRVAGDALAAAGPRVRFRLLPLDWGWIPARAVRRERPALFVLLETELWPVLLAALRRAGVPVLLANGRISPRSFRRYRAVRAGLGPVTRSLSLVLARSAGDADRFRALGVPGERVRVAGNLKHDPSGEGAGGGRAAAVRARLGADAGRPVVVAGSLRGEESGLVLAAFRGMLAAEPRALLVLAPRHPERFDPGALRGWEGSWTRWSEAPPRVPAGVAVVVLDTLGELVDFYPAATFACVGGTWADRGGHNLLEPARAGAPVVFGPGFGNFEDEGRALIAAGGGFVAAGGEELAALGRRLLTDAAFRGEAGGRALAAAATFGGATEAALAATLGLLDAAAPVR